MLTIGDIIALAKNGYKPSDIRELMSLDTAEPVGKVNEDMTAEVIEDQAAEVIEDQAVIVNEDKAAESETPDYKALYFETLEKLNKAQEINIKKDIETKIDIDKELEDIFRSFMN